MMLFATALSSYFWFYTVYSESVLSLHKAVLLVLMVATLEAASWFIAYVTLNESGSPYCCPFPGQVVAAILLQVVRQTISRSLLLTMSLGYGIARDRLESYEVGLSFVVLSFSSYTPPPPYSPSDKLRPLFFLNSLSVMIPISSYADGTCGFANDCILRFCASW
jgi:hypothetical protein